MSDKDLPNMDDVELPDIPDDEELDSADAAEADAGGHAEGAGSAGEGSTLPGPLARLGPLLAPIAALFGGLGAKLGGPVASAAAPVGRVLAPVGAIAGPLVARVPKPILAGVGSFAGILVVIVLLASVVGGGRSAAEASNAGTKAAPVKSAAAPSAELPKPTPKPAYTPTPSGPTPTPTPVIWEERPPSSWIAHGAPLPKAQSEQHLIPRHILKTIDDPREEFTLVTRFEVLYATGPLAPWWGIVLAYQDASHHLTLYFSTDSYNGNKPAAGVMLANGAAARPLGPPVPLPEIPWWGRDTHEVRVTVGEKIETWLNGYPMGTWQNPRQTIAGGPKGIFLIGPSKMRFDAFELE